MTISKEAYYFSHDSNARSDPKILAMIKEYGMEGYGRFWVIIETLREQQDYKLPHKQYVCNALAMQMQCAVDALQSYLKSCIETYELLSSDGEYFWSNSLIRRMEQKEERSRQASKAAHSRWDKQRSNADAMQEQCDSNAIKRKESKGKENKKEDLPEKKKLSPPYAEIVEVFNETCTSLPKVKTVTENRKKAIRGRWDKLKSLDGFKEIFRLVEKSDFLTGRKPSEKNPDWKADFDWLLNEQNMAKLLEGKYNNRASPVRDYVPSTPPGFRVV
jgi:hypothetical protein